MRRVLTAALILMSLQLSVVAAEVKPLQLVHPFPPAGPAEVVGTAAADKVLRTMQRYAAPAFTDVVAMHVAHVLQAASDDPVVVTRKPRRGGREAVMAVSGAPVDRTTLLLALSTDGRSPAIAAAPPTDVALRTVSVAASMPYVLIATRESRYQKGDDLVSAARMSSARILIGTPGEKTVGHVAIDRLRAIEGVHFEPLAYNGGVKALQALVAGQVSAALVPLPAGLPHLMAGRLKALALAEERRHPAIPLVPTSAEAGLGALHAVALFAVFAAEGTPAETLRELVARLAPGASSAEVRQTFHELGLRLERESDTAPAYRGITGTTSRDAFRPPS